MLGLCLLIEKNELRAFLLRTRCSFFWLRNTIVGLLIEHTIVKGLQNRNKAPIERAIVKSWLKERTAVRYVF